MDWDNHLEKNPIQKTEKTVKNQSEIAVRDQKKHKRESEFLFKLRFLTLH